MGAARPCRPRGRVECFDGRQESRDSGLGAVGAFLTGPTGRLERPVPLRLGEPPILRVGNPLAATGNPQTPSLEGRRHRRQILGGEKPEIRDAVASEALPPRPRLQPAVHVVSRPNDFWPIGVFHSRSPLWPTSQVTGTGRSVTGP